MRVCTLNVRPSTPVTGNRCAMSVTALNSSVPDFGGIRFRIVQVFW
jgi:hypothetical protein